MGIILLLCASYLCIGFIYNLILAYAVDKAIKSNLSFREIVSKHVWVKTIMLWPLVVIRYHNQGVMAAINYHLTSRFQNELSEVAEQLAKVERTIAAKEAAKFENVKIKKDPTYN